jgi:hypothetical protein
MTVVTQYVGKFPDSFLLVLLFNTGGNMFYQNTGWHSVDYKVLYPENRIFDNHWCENLKFYKVFFFCYWINWDEYVCVACQKRFIRASCRQEAHIHCSVNTLTSTLRRWCKSLLWIARTCLLRHGFHEYVLSSYYSKTSVEISKLVWLSWFYWIKYLGKVRCSIMLKNITWYMFSIESDDICV